MGPVPDTLRAVLEETLSQDATQQNLERYLPKIRDIIIQLLHGLKRKQQKLRQRSGRESGGSRRQGSLASATTIGNDSQRSLPDSQSYPSRDGSSEPSDGQSLHKSNSSGGTTSSQKQNGVVESEPRRSGSSGRSTHSYVPPVEVSAEQPPLPVPPPVPPYPQQTVISGPTTSPPMQQLPRPPPKDVSQVSRPQPQPQPRPQPRQQDALTALQKGGDLERRASRRFSAYQINKQLGTTSAGVPMIPPPQRSPIPNRGRDIRESMTAVKSRGSQIQRSRSRHGSSRSPERKGESISNIRQSLRDQTNDSNARSFAPPTDVADLGSPNVKTPEDKYARPPTIPEDPMHAPGMRATITRPWDDGYPIPEVIEPSADNSPVAIAKPLEPEPQPEPQKTSEMTKSESAKPDLPKDTHKDTVARQSVIAEPLTLFLQYKTKVKKMVLPGGYEELSVARLQLAFIEKFSWNTHSTNKELPEIYIQDQISGVRHELEDLMDVKNHSVLVLNVDDMDEIKQHFDTGLGGIQTLLEGIQASVSEQRMSIQQVSQQQQDTSTNIARFSTTSVSSAPSSSSAATVIARGVKGSKSQLEELSSLRRDLAVLKQTYATQVSNMQAEMANVKAKAAAVAEAAAKTTVSSATDGSGRTYVNGAKNTLSKDSESIVERVDDLQDLVEDLRKDVVTRGVRPRPTQLDSVNKELTAVTADLKKLGSFVKRERPIWKKINAQILEEIVDDDNVLKLNEDLITDLEDDLEKTSETFALVEQATKQQNLQNGPTGSTRSSSRTLNPVPVADLSKAKDQFLGQVRALQVNHESRLEAIERTERLRQTGMSDTMNNAFKKELGQFVSDEKLRKTGGVEETERVRLKREAEAREENNRLLAERARQREAEAAAAEEEDDDDDGELVEEEDGELGAATGGPPRLDIPDLHDDGAVSPEPEFVEAQESPLANGAGS